ncbi:MAG: hypothetical protein RLZ67_88, partial [Actinomycetota bacterium]
MLTRLRWAAYSSIGAGLIHGIAVGLHAEHASAARAFLVLAVLQIGWGIAALFSFHWQIRLAGLGISIAAVAGWVLTRTSGIAFIDGLQIAEDPQAADSLCAFLAVVAVGAILWATQRGNAPVHRTMGMNAAYTCVAIGLVGAWSATGVVHLHGEVELVDGGLTIDANGVIITPGQQEVVAESSDATTTTTAGSTEENKESSSSTKKSTTTSSTTTTTIHGHVQTSDQAKAAASGWPRAYDPNQPVNLTGIQGFTPEQGQRALTLLENT